jgi:hypothetical protein
MRRSGVRAAAIGDDQAGFAQLGQVVAGGAVGEVQDSTSSPLISSPAVELNRCDMILTLAGSARAFSRSATSSASSTPIGPATTGAQHTGAENSGVDDESLFSVHAAAAASFDVEYVGVGAGA